MVLTVERAVDLSNIAAFLCSPALSFLVLLENAFGFGTQMLVPDFKVASEPDFSVIVFGSDVSLIIFSVHRTSASLC